MLQGIKVRDRESAPRKLRKQITALKKEAWFLLGSQFHREYRDKRFTEEHAKEAGYTKRKGQGMARGSKAWRRSYHGRKTRSSDLGGGAGVALPLVYSGDTRELVRKASITNTSKGVKVKYPGARKLNFRHPKSKIRMADEFRRILPREEKELAEGYDENLDAKMKQL